MLVGCSGYSDLANPSRLTSRVLIVGLVAAMPVSSACGSSDKMIDHSVAESAVKASSAEAKEVGAVAQCPAAVKSERDAPFTCLVTLTNGTTSTFTGRQTNTAGNLYFQAVSTVGG